MRISRKLRKSRPLETSCSYLERLAVLSHSAVVDRLSELRWMVVHINDIDDDV